MIVPQIPALRAGREPTAGGSELPVAPATNHGKKADLTFWTEEAWDKHSREIAGPDLAGMRSPWVFFILLFTPAVLTLAVLSSRKALFLDVWLTLFVLFIVLIVAMATSMYCGRWLAYRYGYGEFVAHFFSFLIFFANGFVVMAGCVHVDRSP